MNEIEQLNQSRQQLKQSFSDLGQDLKNYGEALINHADSKFLNFKANIAQKVTVAKGKLGNIKNSFLQKLNPTNIDVKFRNIVERVEIKGLELAAKGKDAVMEVKDRVEDFATTQIANYYLAREEKKEQKQILKEYKEAAKIAEMEEIQRIKERKAAMKEPIAAKERETYDQQHLDNEQRKEELMRQLFGEPEVEQELRVSRAM